MNEWTHSDTTDQGDDPPDELDMTTRDHEADDQLIALIARTLHHYDSTPADVVAAARGAYAWRTIDDELADLVFDSARELTGVRDRNSSRQLTFRSKGCEIEIMVVDAAERRLVGQIVPAQASTVTLVGTDEEFERTSDQHGRFSFDRVQVGPVRLSVLPVDGSPAITTDWVLL